MWTDQIETILRSDPVCRPLFGGVYPCDQLPQSKPPGKRLYVANTDPAHRPGEHWVAFYFHPNGTCYYFDSYGLPPARQSFHDFMGRNAESWTGNLKRIQHHQSNVCGHYCIFFGVHICRGLSMQDIVKMFDADKKMNDLMAVDFVEHYYPISHDVVRSNSSHQTCICALKSNFLLQ